MAMYRRCRQYWDEDENGNFEDDGNFEDESEETDPREYEEQVDEEMEATLYSLIHYKCDDTMADIADDPVDVMNSLPDSPYVFSVTTIENDSNRPSVIQAQENIHFDIPSDSEVSDSTSDSEACNNNSSSAQPKKESQDLSSTSNSESRDENPGQPCQKKDAYLKSTRPDTAVSSSSTSTSDSESSDDASGQVQQNKAKFDMEAELGIRTKSPKKKQEKMEHDKNTQHQTSESQKVPVSSPTLQSTICVKTGKSASPAKKDCTETGNQPLIDRPRSEKVIVIKPGRSSSSENESESCEESESSSTSLSSDSKSDIQVLGSAGSDTSSDLSASKHPLDLNWNVTSSDRHTIETIEKRSSKVNESLWKINDADLAAFTKSPGSRYYSKKEVRCHNCDKEGHLSKVCPVPRKKPRCGLCGDAGHFMQRCPLRLCYNCSQPGHRGSDCPHPRRSRFSRCARCLVKGHTEDQCTDLWRQFHLTTTTAEDLTPSKEMVNPNVYCCNCAKKGHFAFECRQERMDVYSVPTSPFIARYEAYLSKITQGKWGNSSHQETCSADWESEDMPRGKRFKANHHHHHHKAPQRTWRHKQLFPRGSKSSGGGSEPRAERYFNAQQPSSHSRPQHGAPSSYKSRQWRGRKDHRSAGSWRDRRQWQPRLTGFTKPLVESFLPRDNDELRNRPGKGGGSKSGKKQSRHVTTSLVQSFSANDNDQQRDDRPGKEDSGSSQSGKKRSPGAGEKEEGDSFKPTPPKKRKRRKRRKSAQKEKYTSQGNDGTVTSGSGFRTTMKTVNYNHNCRNAQQK